jgi:hypothetical protein
MSYTGKAIDLSKYEKYGKQVELTKVEVELGLIDDLNEALVESQEILNGLKKDNQRIIEMQKGVEKTLKEQEKLDANKKKSSDNYFKLESQFLSAKKQLENDVELLKRNKDGIDTWQSEKEKAEKDKQPKVKKAQSLIVVFDKNIQKAETSAKELGIKLPIAQYQKALEELKRNL